MISHTALLRPPPFPQLDASAFHRGGPPCFDVPTGEELERVFSAMREAQVGGAFWADPIKLALPETQLPVETVIRSRSSAEVTQLKERQEGQSTLSLIHAGGQETIDPWSVLPFAKSLWAHGSDEWIAIASLLGLKVQVLSPGIYGDPNDTIEALLSRTAHAFERPMRDPFSSKWLKPIDAIARLAEWRRVIDANRGEARQRLVAACGISWWKRNEIERFLWSPGRPVRIYASTKRALKAAQNAGGAVAVWPSRISPDLIDQAQREGVALARVEDGFVRSVGLGSNLVPPLSVVVDRRGIHFDPSQPSDLEVLLATTDFSARQLERAARLRKAIVEAGISKYSSGSSHSSQTEQKDPSRRIVLVPGQVEDDMSVLAGGGGMTSNLELLRRAREFEPDALIWWRPHPDVDAGHRNGFVSDEDALQYADEVKRDGSMADLLQLVDGLHVLTSLSGFEALLRGRDVTCHGAPFYAGWGLTRDLGRILIGANASLNLMNWLQASCCCILVTSTL